VSADLNVDSQRIIEVLAMVIPPAAAVLATVTNTVNLWLAGRIVSVSGHLRRPWPDLPAMRFPPYAPVLLAAPLAASFQSNIWGTASAILAASLLMAYAILGFAVLHTITRGAAGRALILASAYVAVFLLFWPILLLTLTGLADTAFNLRGRFANRNLPPMSGGST
jgi:hypothetical protein